LVGAGPVTYQIAEVPESVEGACGVENGGEGFEVSVDVGEDKGAHDGRF
jgi:hypothetical protein